MNNETKTETTNEINERPIRAGVFATLFDADQAVASLLQNDFKEDQISVLCSDEARERHYEEMAGGKGTAPDDDEGISASSAIGVSLGGFAVLGSVVATGGVSLVAAGALFGLGITGTLVGMMASRGIEGDLADFYDQEVGRGKLLVAVESDDPDRLERAAELLRNAGSHPLELDRG